MKMRQLLYTVAFGSGLYCFGAVGGALAQGTQLFAVLLGGNEVSAGGAANAGDQNGHGAAAITFGDTNLRTLCIGVVVSEIGPPTLMHIHRERAGQNGAVVVTLNPPVKGNPGRVSQCVEITAALSEAIRTRPSNFYVNVHNAAFPNGAIRGQLF
jgi:CHRD domain